MTYLVSGQTVMNHLTRNERKYVRRKEVDVRKCDASEVLAVAFPLTDGPTVWAIFDQRTDYRHTLRSQLMKKVLDNCTFNRYIEQT